MHIKRPQRKEIYDTFISEKMTPLQMKMVSFFLSGFHGNWNDLPQLTVPELRHGDPILCILCCVSIATLDSADLDN